MTYPLELPHVEDTADSDASKWDDGFGTNAAPTAANPVLDDYEARRCAICSTKYPHFGFGSPLTRTGGVDLWACGAHRMELDHRLSAIPLHADAPVEQRSLF